MKTRTQTSYHVQCKKYGSFKDICRCSTKNEALEEKLDFEKAFPESEFRAVKRIMEMTKEEVLD